MSSVIEPLILSLETATGAGSLAVARGAKILATRQLDSDSKHAEHLLGGIDAILRSVNFAIGEIELFAVACGPGSFTGLRTGLATVKAFAAILEKPVVGVPTLEAIAQLEGKRDYRIVALLRAGRSEVFAQSFVVTTGGKLEESDVPSHVQPAKLFEELASEGGDILWTGAAARTLCGAIDEAARQFDKSFSVSSDFEFACDGDHSEDRDGGDRKRQACWVIASPPDEPLAVAVARLALDKFTRGEVVGAQDLRALYVRLSDAELKEQCREHN